MNAIQFIQQHGVEKAREVVEGAPEGAAYFLYDSYYRNRNPVEWYYWEENQWKFTSYSEKFGHLLVDLKDLKRLVESVDLVKRYGGIAEAKTIHNDEFWCERAFERLEQAIADYESIYSNDCEILDYPEDYTSPNCKKYDERVK